MLRIVFAATWLFAGFLLAGPAQSQPPAGRGGFGRGFPGPPGGMGRAETKLVKKHDENDDGWLNTQERLAARAALQNAASGGGPWRGRGPRFGRGGNR
ncbi:MAG: hypothetical protein KDA44_14280, partial [Planctomycetales bacterium]|nr:hypothetical protein [Planctomycetales bacterium]